MSNSTAPLTIRALIDAIVRQTVVLIAQLATAGGLRAPLAQIAEQVFLDLARELEKQGVTRKVSADMFGMALRTYQRRVQRVAHSRTDRGRSLWEAVLDYVRAGGTISRDNVLTRFRYDDEASVRGVLRDLADSGLVFVSGAGRYMAYRATDNDDLGRVRDANDRAALDALVWSVVFREGPASADLLAELSQLPRAAFDASIAALVDEGRVERLENGGEVQYRAREIVLGFDDPAGWEASVLDHFAALVRTIGGKLAKEPRAQARDEVGGSTYHYVLWRGHPLYDEVLGELARFRARSSELRARVDQHNAEHGILPAHLAVTTYYGQSVVEECDETED